MSYEQLNKISEPRSEPVEQESPPHEGVVELLFGRYQILRELGRGGMGIVHLAHDRILEIPVAIKLIPPEVLGDTDGIADLKREVLRGISLTHKGIVRIFSFEQDASTAGIVMEFVEGETLGDLKARQPHRCFDAHELHDWLEELCEVLDYAHQEARVAHRDLKPRNLMVTTNGHLKVADFGVASSITETLSRVSAVANASGTPPYMSPQQAMGQQPSASDDIYSLGATLYELLTSKPPFYRGNLIAQVLHETPPSIAQRRRDLDITGREDVPEEWERLVAACLSKDPEDRPSSGHAVLAMLDSGTRAQPIETPRPPQVGTETPAASDREAPIFERPIPARQLLPLRHLFQKFSSTIQTLIAIWVAAAFAGGVIHFVRHRPASADNVSAENAKSTHTPNSTPAPERIEGTVLPPRPPSKPGALTSGRLDDPPKALKRRAGPGPNPGGPPGPP